MYLTATNFGFVLNGVGFTMEKIAFGTCRRTKFSVSGSIGKEDSFGSEKDQSDNLVFSIEDIADILAVLKACTKRKRKEIS